MLKASRSLVTEIGSSPCEQSRSSALLCPSRWWCPDTNTCTPVLIRYDSSPLLPAHKETNMMRIRSLLSGRCAPVFLWDIPPVFFPEPQWSPSCWPRSHCFPRCHTEVSEPRWPLQSLGRGLSLGKKKHQITNNICYSLGVVFCHFSQIKMWTAFSCSTLWHPSLVKQ